ncbi:MAG: FtsX-like permease family protein [Clostridium sp.]|nr:MAG: FtsX-like permease family protein [Clostridium sp.]
MNIGVMKAIGYNKKEIIRYYVGISVALALIGSVIGIIIGPLIIPNVMNIKYNILYQLPKAKFPMFKINYLFSVLILVFLFPLFLAYAQTIKEIKRKPTESIRGESAIKG